MRWIVPQMSNRSLEQRWRHPLDFLQEFTNVRAVRQTDLMARHNISGIQRFNYMMDVRIALSFALQDEPVKGGVSLIVWQPTEM